MTDSKILQLKSLLKELQSELDMDNMPMLAAVGELLDQLNNG